MLYLTSFSVNILRIICDFLYSSVLKMKKKLKIDLSILDIFNKKYLPYIIKIIINEQYSSLNVGKICWTTNKELDISINAMKANAINFVHLSLSCIKKGEKISQDFANELNILINYGIQLFEFTISNKFEYLKLMSSSSKEFPDNNYEKFLYNYLTFFSRILYMEPFITAFSPFIFK